MEEGGFADDFLFIDMEISRPISYLKQQLSRLLSAPNINSTSPVFLKGFRLSDDTNLLSSCVVKSGHVFIKCRIKPDTDELSIEIDDVLLAADDNETSSPAPNQEPASSSSASSKELPTSAYETNGYLWKVDCAFKDQQVRRHMPVDPLLWSAADVRLWLGWARSVFRTAPSQSDPKSLCELASVAIIGSDLCALSRETLAELVVPRLSADMDRLSDLLSVHMTLLKQQHCIFRPWPISREEDADSLSAAARPFAVTPFRNNQITFVEKDKAAKPVQAKPCLWRFMLDCLTEPGDDMLPVIRWNNASLSEFVIANPEEFAAMWARVNGRHQLGEKGKPTPATSTASLARALRMYTSEGVILSRVTTSGSWTYRFEADLSKLIGYSATQLQQLQSSTLQNSQT